MAFESLTEKLQNVFKKLRSKGVLTEADVKEAMKEVKQVVEGVYSAKAALQLADKYDVEAPIIRTVNRVLFGNESPSQAVEDLMLREGRIESSGLQWQ